MRPAILAVLLAGIVLTLVMAPSALDAQQAPPGEAPATGYGAGPSHGAVAARVLDIKPIPSPASNPVIWWVVAVLAAALVLGGGLLLHRRRA